jgi:hypothetical protein
MATDLRSARAARERRLRPASQAELGEDVRHVMLGGAATDDEAPARSPRSSIRRPAVRVPRSRVWSAPELLGECAPDTRSGAAVPPWRRVGGRADPLECPERKPRLSHGFGCVLGQRPRARAARAPPRAAALERGETAQGRLETTRARSRPPRAARTRPAASSANAAATSSPLAPATFPSRSSASLAAAGHRVAMRICTSISSRRTARISRRLTSRQRLTSSLPASLAPPQRPLPGPAVRRVRLMALGHAARLVESAPAGRAGPRACPVANRSSAVAASQVRSAASSCPPRPPPAE